MPVSEQKETKANKNKSGGPKCQASEVFINNSNITGTSSSLEPSAHTINKVLVDSNVNSLEAAPATLRTSGWGENLRLPHALQYRQLQQVLSKASFHCGL